MQKNKQTNWWMIALWILFLLSVIMATSGSRAQVQYNSTPGVIVIGDNPGGEVWTFAQFYGWIKASGVPVRVRGICISACTLVLALPREQVCIEPTGTMALHLAATETPAGKMEPDRDASAAFVRRFYPKELQDYLAKHPLTPKLMYLSADELVKNGIMRACE